MQTWQLQNAKARLSEVVKKTILNGPQAITLRGKEVIVMLSKKEYDELIQPKLSFTQFMRRSPLIDVEIDLSRNDSLTRQFNF